MTYICECGKKFDKPNSFNGHKSHCRTHLEKTGRLHIREDIDLSNKQKISNTLLDKSNIRRLEEQKEWASEEHICEKCGKVMVEKFGSGRFCSKSCANSRTKSPESKLKTSNSLLNSMVHKEYAMNRHLDSEKSYYNNPRICSICNEIIPYQSRSRTTCSNECLTQLLSISGRKSVNSQVNSRRSKNEILFYELCAQHFNHVSNNSAIFDGWDADVIIHDHKIAVLWNGAWHYEKITRQHSVEQVQNRDRIKVDKIVENGYIPYIIKDMGSYNETFVKQEFTKFLDYVSGL